MSGAATWPVTARLSQPIAPLSRAERLSRKLPNPIDGCLSSPNRLTVQHPTKSNWVPSGTDGKEVLGSEWASGRGQGYASWCVPSSTNVGGMDAVVFDPPQGLSLLTLYLATRTEPGHVGNILIEVLKGYDIIASFQLSPGRHWLVQYLRPRSRRCRHGTLDPDDHAELGQGAKASISRRQVFS